eukprot:GGOE01035557.1.p7 GENE.GGOE01035557.1~~GGOE01035557.1.p7  ORF type:complete len:104 (+),score=4.95 GGOE01035557.1:2113-2424(+)
METGEAWRGIAGPHPCPWEEKALWHGFAQNHAVWCEGCGICFRYISPFTIATATAAISCSQWQRQAFGLARHSGAKAWHSRIAIHQQPQAVRAKASKKEVQMW